MIAEKIMGQCQRKWSWKERVTLSFDKLKIGNAVYGWNEDSNERKEITSQKVERYDIQWQCHSVGDQDLIVINLNAQSIMNKVVDLEHILIEHNYHIVMITETWLHLSIFDCEVLPPRYNIFQSDWTTRGGVVAIVVRDSLVCTDIQGSSNIKKQVVWI